MERPTANKARRTGARFQLQAYAKALLQYRADVGDYPRQEDGLTALRQAPPGAHGWRGPYVQKDIEPDPWGHSYVYRYPGEHEDPDLICYGADGKPGGYQDAADIVQRVGR